MSGSLVILGLAAAGAYYCYRQNETSEDRSRLDEASNAEHAEQSMAKAQREDTVDDSGTDGSTGGYTENEAKWDTEMKFWAFYDTNFQQWVNKLPDSDLRHLNTAELQQLRAIAFDYYDQRGWNFSDFDKWSGTPEGFQQILQGVQNVKLKTCMQQNGYSGYTACQAEYPLGETSVHPTDYVDSSAPHSNAAGSYALGVKKKIRKTAHATDSWHN
jgi:hypothetical protein